jgi:hypothetical protein
MAFYQIPEKGKTLTVTAAVKLYRQPDTKSERVYPADSRRNVHRDFVASDKLTSLGLTFNTNEGTFLAVYVPTWYRRNVLQSWSVVPTEAYYRLEDNTAFWVSDAPVVGTGGNTGNTGQVNTGGTGQPAPPATTPPPSPDKGQSDNSQTLAIVAIIIGLLTLLKK